MAIEVTEQSLPSGQTYYLVVLSGELDREGSEATQRIVTAKKQPMVVTMSDDFRISLANRDIVFQASDDGSGTIAMVVKSPVVRAMLAFLQKTVIAYKGKVGRLNFFATVDEAKVWLEAELRRLAA